jgi:hypothetical protein
VQNGLKCLRGIPLIPDISGMRGISTAARVHIPRRGGHYDTKKVLSQCEQRFDKLDQIAILPVIVPEDVTKEMVPPPPPPCVWAEPMYRRHV